MDTLEVRNRGEWRKWLGKHHGSKSEIWLVFYKKHTGVKTLSYEEVVEQAICYGWIDSVLRRLDEDRYARKFTPRRPDSNWSTHNRRRYENLKKRGLLAPPGKLRPPTNRTGDAPRPSLSALPSYLEKGLRKNRKAWCCFEKLPPSHKRAYIGWIDSAKKQETKERRLREAISLLADGKKLGLK